MLNAPTNVRFWGKVDIDQPLLKVAADAAAPMKVHVAGGVDERAR